MGDTISIVAIRIRPIFEAHEFLLEGERNITGRTVTLLGNNELCLTPLALAILFVISINFRTHQ